MNKVPESFHSPLSFQLGVDAIRNVTSFAIVGCREGWVAANPVIVTDICCVAISGTLLPRFPRDIRHPLPMFRESLPVVDGAIPISFPRRSPSSPPRHIQVNEHPAAVDNTA